jgi:hypothetical protein
METHLKQVHTQTFSFSIVFYTGSTCLEKRTEQNDLWRKGQDFSLDTRLYVSESTLGLMLEAKQSIVATQIL